MSKKIILMFSAFVIVFSFAASIFLPATSNAAACKSEDANFLGFPTWYRGISKDDGKGGCTVKFDGTGDDIGAFIWKIVLNIIEIALRIIGIIATGYILYGGFTYLTSNGSPEKAAKGLNLIMGAAIGLIISISSIGIINKLFEIIPSDTVQSNGIYELSVADVISSVTSIIYWIAGAVAVIMFVISGLRFITSAGNPSGVQKARSTMVHSVIGLVVIILAFTITNVILGFFK